MVKRHFATSIVGCESQANWLLPPRSQCPQWQMSPWRTGRRCDNRCNGKVRQESRRGDAAIHECDDPVGLIGDAAVVGDHDYSEVLITVQLTQDRHDLVAARLIEVASL